MNLNKLFEEFEKQFLYLDNRKKNNFEDKNISKIDVINCFSIFVNYHSDVCIHIFKDPEICSRFWRIIKIKYDLSKLYIHYDKICKYI